MTVPMMLVRRELSVYMATATGLPVMLLFHLDRTSDRYQLANVDRLLRVASASLRAFELRPPGVPANAVEISPGVWAVPLSEEQKVEIRAFEAIPLAPGAVSVRHAEFCPVADLDAPLSVRCCCNFGERLAAALADEPIPPVEARADNGDGVAADHD